MFRNTNSSFLTVTTFLICTVKYNQEGETGGFTDFYLS